MNMVKDLMANEELLNYITDSIDILPEDALVSYEVWAIGYDTNEEVTDAEVLLRTFSDPDEAIEYAKTVTLADVVDMSTEENFDADLDYEIKYISVEVETAIDDNDEGTMNIGTIYRNKIVLKEEDICLTSDDYEVLDDGTLKIPCSLLKNFKENDCVKICFEGDLESTIISYKIMSKLTQSDTDYYICDFLY